MRDLPAVYFESADNSEVDSVGNDTDLSSMAEVAAEIDEDDDDFVGDDDNDSEQQKPPLR